MIESRNLLSLVIPAYNASTSLEHLLRLIQEQLVNGVDVVVVDDGSTDETLEIAQRFVSSDIRVVHQENGGVSAARNRGIEESNAEFIWFVDADDEILPNAIGLICNRIQQYPCDCYLFGLEKRFGNITKTIANSNAEHLSSMNEIVQRFDVLFSQNLLNPLWNKIFSKNIIEKNDLRFKKMVSGEDAEFVLRFYAQAQTMYVMTDVLYRYMVLSNTSSSRTFQPKYIQDHEQMFEALNDYSTTTGASVTEIRKSWRYETAMGFRWNVYNEMGDQCNFRSFSQKMKREKYRLEELLELVDGERTTGGLRSLVLKTSFFSYMFISLRVQFGNMRERLQEIKNNPGLLPKILVFVIRFGMWAERIKKKPIRLFFKILYRFIDLLFCKLLLNCDISPKACIGNGLVIYHPYGIIINSDVIIGKNFTCRAQVTIGNKGIAADNGCPIIGDNVNVGVGARIIGPIHVGNNCVVGANAVVINSSKDCSILVGVPAKDKRKI